MKIINEYLLKANDNELYDIFIEYFTSEQFYNDINNNDKKFIIKFMFITILYNYYDTRRYQSLCDKILMNIFKNDKLADSNNLYYLKVLLSYELELI